MGLILNVFQYRTECTGKGRWGGIWRAPIMYSAASEVETQTNIEKLLYLTHINIMKKAVFFFVYLGCSVKVHMLCLQLPLGDHV